MLLIDTSVWIEHFRRGVAALAASAAAGEVLLHPFVLGELACGQLSPRAETLASLAELPEAPVAEQPEVLAMIERHRLFQSGIGWVDAHLLASSLIAHEPLWTLDRRLALAAQRLGITQPVQ
jgi:predicted nucleic acid-binding protein